VTRTLIYKTKRKTTVMEKDSLTSQTSKFKELVPTQFKLKPNQANTNKKIRTMVPDIVKSRDSQHSNRFQSLVKLTTEFFKMYNKPKE
jgi:hypothetical protein